MRLTFEQKTDIILTEIVIRSQYSMEKYIIAAKSGRRFEVSKGQNITIIDAEGGQVADFFAVLKASEDEFISPAVTIDCNGSLNIGVGTVLYSSMYRPMFEIKHDDVGKHDLLFPACSKAMYDFFYRNGKDHPNCLDNLNLALGLHKPIICPVNLFMNTTVSADGKVKIGKPLSQAGDKIIMTALQDCFVGISACSVEGSDTNSGKCTSIAVLIE